MRHVRPVQLCRSWLFVEGANEQVLRAAARCGADVLIQELEDFTPPASRPRARELAAEMYRLWRDAGAVVAVRVNPLDGDGMDDLAAVMRGAPDIVALPKVAGPDDVLRLDEAVTRLERAYGLAPGSTALLPNIEFARGLVQTGLIAKASPRVTACLMASEDLAADLGVARTPGGDELAYSRQRFFVECVAAGVVAVDCPYTFSDSDGVARDTGWARRMGYVAKSLVDPAHVVIVNRVIGPDEDEMARARAIVMTFEAARARGEGRVEFDGALIELPSYRNAQRLLARGEAMRQFNSSPEPATPA